MKSVKKLMFFVLLLTLFLSVTVVSAYGTEHKHRYIELYTAKPTCDEKGFTVFSCDCGDSYEGNITQALGHNYSKDIVYYKKATCIEMGEAGRYCRRCYNKTDIVYYAKTVHTPVTVTEKATLKTNGEKRKECSVCKKLYSSRLISKIASVKLKKNTYTYDGKIKTPGVIVKDSEGKTLLQNTDYSLKYQKGRKKTGKYSVKVTFTGNYEGTKTLYFKIRPTAAKKISAVPSVSSAYLSWDKSKGADGYEIYLKSSKLKLLKVTDNLYCTVNKIDGKKLKSGKDYIFVIKSYKKSGETKIYSASKEIKVSTKPQKAQIKKISSSSGKTTVTALKQNGHGYEILLSTNKSFSNAKSVRLKGKNSVSYSFKNLIRGKTYYVKVRAYVISGGDKYCGYYSEAKSFKV